MMKKKVIKITENELKHLIYEGVRAALNGCTHTFEDLDITTIDIEDLKSFVWTSIG